MSAGSHKGQCSNGQRAANFPAHEPGVVLLGAGEAGHLWLAGADD